MINRYSVLEDTIMYYARPVCVDVAGIQDVEHGVAFAFWTLLPSATWRFRAIRVWHDGSFYSHLGANAHTHTHTHIQVDVGLHVRFVSSQL